MPPRSEIRALLRAQIERLWGAGHLELVDANYAAGVVDRMPVPGQPGGRAALRDVVRAFRAGLPDLAMTLHGTLACGDMGVDFWTLTGTHTGPLFGVVPTGRAVRFSGVDMVRVGDDGRISELWHVEEMLQFWEQLGHRDAVLPQLARPRSAGSLRPGGDPGAGARVPDPALLTPGERRNLVIARQHIEGLWARGDTALAPLLYAEGVIDHNPAPGQRPGIAGILDVLGWLRAAVPDLAMRIEHYVVDGDLAADRWTMCGTHTGAPLMGIAARGRTFQMAGMDVIRIDRDGHITDVWHAEQFDRLLAAIM